MFARGALLTEVHRNVVVVPVTALVRAAARTASPPTRAARGSRRARTTLPPQQVLLVGPGSKAVAKIVTVGIVADSQAEITSGLRPGDRLITTGQGIVQPGQPVKVQSGADQTADGCRRVRPR